MTPGIRLRYLPLLVASLTSCAASAPAAPEQPPSVVQPAEAATSVKPAAAPPQAAASSSLPVASSAAPAPVASSAAPASPAPPPSLRWRLEIAPSKMSMAGRARCRVRVLVTNEGAQAASPVAYPGTFEVDGNSSMAADLAFGNGTIDRRWMSLPPKETASMERELCAELFPKPGKYTVGYRVGSDVFTATAVVSP